MLEVLRILLCGVGAVYLVIRFGCFLRSLIGRRPLWPPAREPAEDRSRAGKPATCEQAAAISRRASA